MCFYQDTQLLSKRIFSNLRAWEDSHDSKFGTLTKTDQEAMINDTLVKKKKLFGRFSNFSLSHLFS